MPSDPRVIEALDMFSEAVDRYRASVVATLEDIRGELAVTHFDKRGRTDQLKAQLGPFGGNRIDADRLASVLNQDRALGSGALARLEAAYETLQSIALGGKDLFCLEVPPGTDIAAAISAQLAAIGRAFGAARVAASARGVNAALNMSDEQALTRFPFSEWNPSERRLAPPLIVSVSGRELIAGALSRFLDAAMKIVLLVDGPCAPAPLVRLITPNVLVVQAHELKELHTLATWPGTAIGALMPPTGARFVHDPSAGPELWQRLTVGRARDGRLSRLGGLSAAQQNEEILQLEVLASPPAVAPARTSAVISGGAASDPAERLASWLIQQANLASPEAGHA